MRLDLRAVAVRRNRQVGMRARRKVASPGPDIARQLPRDLTDVHAVCILVRAQQSRCTGVDQPDAVAGVEHNDALPQVLHDVLVQLGEVGQVDATLARERLAELDAPGKRPRGQ